MNPPSRAPQPDALFRQLAHATPESATVAQFLALYRHSPELRHWLREDFARDARLRARFHARALREPAPAITRIAELAGDAAAWNEERRHLKARVPARLYGGLTCNEIERLILRHRAGGIDGGAFLLAQEWRQAGASAASSPMLARAAVTLVDAALRAGEFRLLRHLAQATRLPTSFQDKPKRRAALGFADWWKLQALLFILRHPRPAYRTRDLRAHLASHGLAVGTKDIRRFCTRHGLARDMRAGRPRTRIATDDAQPTPTPRQRRAQKGRPFPVTIKPPLLRRPE